MTIGSKPAAPALVELAEVVVRRGGRIVLEIDELAIERGSILGIFGPNGAGKSTLLQVMALLQPVDAGTVRIDGRAIDARSNPVRDRRRIGLLLPDPLLFDMSVADNVGIGPRLHGLPSAERRARVDRWLTRLGLDDLRNRPARALSSGEAHRTSLARALAIEPELLLLDEPFRALDYDAHWRLLRELPGLLAEIGATAAIVSHDPRDLGWLADRAIALAGGRIVARGSPAEIAKWAERHER